MAGRQRGRYYGAGRHGLKYRAQAHALHTTIYVGLYADPLAAEQAALRVADYCRTLRRVHHLCAGRHEAHRFLALLGMLHAQWYSLTRRERTVVQRAWLAFAGRPSESNTAAE